MSETPVPIRIANHSNLLQILNQLGIPAPLKDGTTQITKETCDRAGVSFDFLQAFAKLTCTSQTSSPIARLLAKRKPLFDPQGDVIKVYPLLNIDSFLNPQKKESKPPPSPSLNCSINNSNQDEANKLIDSEEVEILLTALKILSQSKSNYPTPSPLRLDNLDLIKTRVSSLDKNLCWLSANMLRIGIFGIFNEELKHQMELVQPFGSPIPSERATTTAQESLCTYLPSLEPLIHGLFFTPQQTPEVIQNAARSTIIINAADAQGSGVVIDSKYILTAAHVISNPWEEKKKSIAITLESNGQKVQGNADIIYVSSKGENGSNPDLALLYFPALPSITPLPFSDNLTVVLPPQGSKDGNMETSIPPFSSFYPHPFGSGVLSFSELKTSYDESFIASALNTESSWKITYKKREEVIYLIGAPHQNGETKLLISPGRFDLNRTTLYPDGSLRINAIGLPGNSGGPVVDSEGKLIGITSLMSYEGEKKDREENLRNSLYGWRSVSPPIKIRTLTGSVIVPVAFWKNEIWQAKQKHQEALRKRPK